MHVPSPLPAPFHRVLRCSACKTDPDRIVCDETRLVRACPGPAVAMLKDAYATMSGSATALPLTAQIRTIVDVLVVTDSLNMHTMTMEAILREDISTLGVPQEAMHLCDLLGGATQVTLARCTDGRLLFCSRAKDTVDALMQAGLLWTITVAPTTQPAALVFPVSLESKILLRRGIKAAVFGTHSAIQVDNVDHMFADLVADACSPALGVPLTTDPDRALLSEYLVGRNWTEQTRRTALEMMGHHIQDPVAWRRYCAFLKTMDDARQTPELIMLVDAMFDSVSGDCFHGVDAYVTKWVAGRQ